MKKFSFILLLALVVGFFHVNAQSINLKLGLFYPSMSRDSDLWDINFENLALSRQDMASEYFGIEYEHFFGKNFSLSLEGGIYSKTVYTMYKDYEFEDGSPIEQDISLRIFSFEIDFKIYPVGHKKNFCPFFGVGAGMYNWKYVQGGDFIIFDDEGDGGYVEEDVEAYTSAYTPGFNARAGFVFKFQKSFGLSFEARYLQLKGTLSSLFEDFNKLDLSGFSLNIGLNFYFDIFYR